MIGIKNLINSILILFIFWKSINNNKYEILDVLKHVRGDLFVFLRQLIYLYVYVVKSCLIWLKFYTMVSTRQNSKYFWPPTCNYRPQYLKTRNSLWEFLSLGNNLEITVNRLFAKYLDFAASIIHCYCGVFATKNFQSKTDGTAAVGPFIH